MTSERLYDLYWIKCDREGKEVSREIVGGGRWWPMTHKQAVTARSKFTIREGYRMQLVEHQETSSPHIQDMGHYSS